VKEMTVKNMDRWDSGFSEYFFGEPINRLRMERYIEDGLV
jgi:hypothetical protein